MLDASLAVSIAPWLRNGSKKDCQQSGIRKKRTKIGLLFASQTYYSAVHIKVTSQMCINPFICIAQVSVIRKTNYFTKILFHWKIDVHVFLYLFYDQQHYWCLSCAWFDFFLYPSCVFTDNSPINKSTMEQRKMSMVILIIRVWQNCNAFYSVQMPPTTEAQCSIVLYQECNILSFTVSKLIHLYLTLKQLFWGLSAKE